MPDEAHPTKVLVVEDESIVALDLQHRLSTLGFEVSGHAASGPDAIARAAEARPQLVLMDIQLRGEMDGIQAAGRIMSEYDIPVVFLTAFSDVESLNRAKQAEAYGYLLKPFQERELRIAIEMALYKHAAERELRSSRTLLDVTINGIAEGVITADAQGTIMLMNDAAVTLTGWERDRAIGAPLQEMTGSADGDSARLRRRDGSEVEVSVSHNRLDDGRSVVVIRDVSAEREYERRLIAARDAAEAAIAARSDFLSRVTHELRTPLNSIQGMSQLLATEIDGREAAEYLEIIEASAGQLNAMIGDLLDYSHIQAGTLELRAETVDSARLVEETVRLVALGSGSEQLRVGIGISPTVPRDIVADPQRISQILRHLAGNAIKFTPSGHVFVGLRRSAEGRLLISVEDTGPGLDPESLSHLLEDFTQAERPATRRAGGLGLGLALVRRLVKSMGGTLEYLPREGGGSVFVIGIPDGTAVGDPPRLRERLEHLEAPVSEVLTDDPFILRIWEPWCTEAGIPIRMLGQPKALMAPESLAVALLRDPRSLPAGATHRVFRIAGARELLARTETPAGVATLVEPVTIDEILRSLDRRPSDASSGGPPGVEDMEDATDLPPSGGPSILIVDDDLHNRIVLERLVAALGFQASAVRSGMEAVESLQNHEFDVALLDIEMPDMDGWELCRVVREGAAGDRCSRIPLIAVSAHERGDILERALESGFDEVLEKPLAGEEIRQVVGDLRAGQALLSDRRKWALIRRALDAGASRRVLDRLKELRNTTRLHELAEISFRLMLAIRRDDSLAVKELIAEAEEELKS